MTRRLLRFAMLLALTPVACALQSGTGDLDGDLERGAILARGHQYPAGLALAKTLAERFPASSSAHQMLGFFQMKCQENLAAVRSYRRALELDAESPDIAVGLAVAQSAGGMEPEAQRTLE